MRSPAFKFAAVGLLALGFMVLGRGVWLFYVETASKTWAEIEGEVIEFRWGHDDGANYPVVRYRYRVDGVEYDGRRTVFGSRTRSTLPELEAGESLPVYYDPRRPGRAALQPRVPTDWWFWVVFGLVFSAAAALQLRWQTRVDRDRAVVD